VARAFRRKGAPGSPSHAAHPHRHADPTTRVAAASAATTVLGPDSEAQAHKKIAAVGKDGDLAGLEPYGLVWAAESHRSPAFGELLNRVKDRVAEGREHFPQPHRPGRIRIRGRRDHFASVPACGKRFIKPYNSRLIEKDKYHGYPDSPRTLAQCKLSLFIRCCVISQCIRNLYTIYMAWKSSCTISYSM
jgi:hypothetical protein